MTYLTSYAVPSLDDLKQSWVLYHDQVISKKADSGKSATTWTPMTVFRRTPTRRVTRWLSLTLLTLVLLCLFHGRFFERSQLQLKHIPQPIRPESYPASSTQRLPRSRPTQLPRIQHRPVAETLKAKALRESRLKEVRNAFLHAWKGYKMEAWTKDELKPVSGGFKTPFCGWAATLVDSLDTLYIMELYGEFDLALLELKNIDFTYTENCNINLFETTIRHLGGFLAAYDLSGGKHAILLEKAIELGEVLFTAFDTPNRMPTPHYLWSASNNKTNNHQPSHSVVLAVLGTLSLEFTRLSQITKNDKYFDAVQRVIDELELWQDNTSLPGMWPTIVDSAKFDQPVALGSQYEGADEMFTLGALADSAYEYLPKQFILLGGRLKKYRTLYEKFVTVAREHLFFRPMTIGDKDILIAGNVHVVSGSKPRLSAKLEHLSCFTGGMLAIAGKIFQRPEDLEDGRRLADGCVWAYRNTATGIMPETVETVPCANKSYCPWDAKLWYKSIDPGGEETLVRKMINNQNLSPGFVSIPDRRYLLRPEAIESVFILYRITGDQYWVESGWDMFKSIQAHTTTSLAHSAIDDVTNPSPEHVDEMESFWLAETLKYFYLLFSDTSVVNLDEYVLNTEAHPLRRPR